MKIVFPKGGIKNFIFCCLLFILAAAVRAETQFLGEEENGMGKSLERTSGGSGFISDDGDGFLATGENGRGRERKEDGKKENDWESGSSFFLESATGSPLFADDAFVEKIEERWGGYERSTRKVWVQYDKDDRAAKSKVDFENGIVEIETVVEAESPEEAEKLSRALVARRLERMYEDDKKSPIPAIAGFVPAKSGASLAGEGVRGFVDAPDFIIEVVEKPSARGRERGRGREARRGKKREDGRKGRKKEYRTKSTIKMVPDHLNKRAREVFPIVQSQCGDYKLEESLVLSVIHVESYFNPRAISGAGAIGLMQLMPQYGGRDAYERIYGKNWIPSQSYLVNPANNVRLGCAYLSMLHEDYFKDIRDDFKKRYASVAGYNWGPGSVRKKVIDKAKLSRMGDEDFFKFLYQKIPDETKNYIVKVRENEGEYSKALKKAGNRR